MSEYRVEKGRLPASLALSNGTAVRGAVFVWHATALREGPERIKDLLNSEGGFFPFEIEAATPHTALFHRDHVVFVTLGSSDEVRHDAGYELAVRRSVSVLLSTGARLVGQVRIYTPPGRDRLSDYVRDGERFRYLEAPAATLIVNTDHVVALTEVDER